VGVPAQPVDRLEEAAVVAHGREVGEDVHVVEEVVPPERILDVECASVSLFSSSFFLCEHIYD
jgi:hypothetical protein